jgi:hypothetical protein
MAKTRPAPTYLSEGQRLISEVHCQFNAVHISTSTSCFLLATAASPRLPSRRTTPSNPLCATVPDSAYGGVALVR